MVNNPGGRGGEDIPAMQADGAAEARVRVGVRVGAYQPSRLAPSSAPHPSEDVHAACCAVHEGCADHKTAAARVGGQSGAKAAPVPRRRVRGEQHGHATVLPRAPVPLEQPHLAIVAARRLPSQSRQPVPRCADRQKRAVQLHAQDGQALRLRPRRPVERRAPVGCVPPRARVGCRRGGQAVRAAGPGDLELRGARQAAIRAQRVDGHPRCAGAHREPDVAVHRPRAAHRNAGPHVHLAAQLLPRDAP
mmetsp:Transcript_35723/g.89738  ORF Transcript_35723/g.89738 Transcript_35723/m.89738 type:complete len:248 (-) Transcript_35723:73-816(-)